MHIHYDITLNIVSSLKVKWIEPLSTLTNSNNCEEKLKHTADDFKEKFKINFTQTV